MKRSSHKLLSFTVFMGVEKFGSMTVFISLKLDLRYGYHLRKMWYLSFRNVWLSANKKVNVSLSTSTVISNEIVENSTTMHRKYVFLSKVLCIKPEVRYISFHFFYLVKTSTCQKRLKMSNFGHMR